MEEVQKAIQERRLQLEDNLDSFSKGQVLPIGTIRTRPNGDFIKTAMGWKYHSKSSKSVAVGTKAKEASSNDEPKVPAKGSMTATYHNKATNETYKLSGLDSLEHAWKMSEVAAKRNNWNHEMFSHDVKVTVAETHGTASPTHIGDMSRSDKLKWAKKLNIKDPEQYSTAVLSNKILDANVDKQLAEYKANKSA